MQQDFGYWLKNDNQLLNSRGDLLTMGHCHIIGLASTSRVYDTDDAQKIIVSEDCEYAPPFTYLH